MTDKIYTRTGTIQNERSPFRHYNFPINGSTNDNIRIQIPYIASKEDILEAIDHLQIIAKRWVEE